MSESYQQEILRLITSGPFGIDTETRIEGRTPSTASSEFLTNKEQGDWAERVVFGAINENSADYVAVKYGRDDTLAAGDEGFSDFFQAYKDELNNIGKKPDLLIFKRSDFDALNPSDLDDDDVVKKAVAAIEVRSSSFLANKYSTYMDNRSKNAAEECARIKAIIIQEPYIEPVPNFRIFKKCAEVHWDCGRTRWHESPQRR
ncbi:MAG: AccI family restriction endonuclease [Opitutus sp.]|nr:AccI family restriction endonuclease [Opitutus sp.]MCS6277025.1 AccI family restriction endonuclease [Opitutus sp.]MCS6299928.1 AccI family restriction endonuclease [Opitutus sp.]